MATLPPDPSAAPEPAAPTSAPAAASAIPEPPVLNLDAPRSQTSAEFTKIVDEQPNVSITDVKRAAGDEKAGALGDKTYSPQDKARDSTRETITLWLIGLFCAIVVLSFATLLAIGVKNRFEPGFFDQLKRLLDVLLGPVLTLLSSAIGFYFGYQQGASQPRSNKDPAPNKGTGA